MHLSMDKVIERSEILNIMKQDYRQSLPYAEKLDMRQGLSMSPFSEKSYAGSMFRTH